MIMQGDQYGLLFYGRGFSIADVAEVEFTVGSLTKNYPETVEYNSTKGCFIFPLTQQETLAMSNYVEAQARVKLQGGDVIGAKIGRIDVQKSLTRTVL